MILQQFRIPCAGQNTDYRSIITTCYKQFRSIPLSSQKHTKTTTHLPKKKQTRHPSARLAADTRFSINAHLLTFLLV